MTYPEKQTTSSVLMVRPANFGFNEETFETCPFQTKTDMPAPILQQKALFEFDLLVKYLKHAGVNALVFEDTPYPVKPDAIFPNNWITFHEGGDVILYPMLAPNRRLERRMDILNSLRRDHGYPTSTILDLRPFEENNQFLEGTGSMVLDRASKIVYACISPRTHIEPLEKFAKNMGYEIFTFHTRDKLAKPVYHTNVVMSVGEKYAVACLEAVADKTEARKLAKKLKDTNHKLINISLDQLYAFCGNILEVKNTKGEPITIMSTQAYKAFNPKQLSVIDKYSERITSPAYTIEATSGGSVRCMLAEIFPPVDS
ncbi:amidinotransferase [Candidatus Daviesbacteria bacterium]|nr:amidinotransferase [Candidatus Daviesbacteria bacterium]